jgi:hypothetical protein
VIIDRRGQSPDPAFDDGFAEDPVREHPTRLRLQAIGPRGNLAALPRSTGRSTRPSGPRRASRR